MIVIIKQILVKQRIILKDEFAELKKQRIHLGANGTEEIKNENANVFNISI